MANVYKTLASGAATGSIGVVSDAVACLVTFQLLGTWTGTVTFQGTVDGTNYVAIQATNLNTGSASTTATANGLYRVDATGLTDFRCNFTTPTSGTVLVYFHGVLG